MVIIIILVSAVLWAAICYFIAKRKDRNKEWAFFIGLIFGFFALIYYLTCEEGDKRCPKCKSRIRKDAQVCKHCSYKNPYFESKIIGWYNKSSDDFLCVDCFSKAKSLNQKNYKPIEENRLETDIYTCDRCRKEFKI